MRLITEIVSKMIMDLSRSQKVTYTVNVAISGKRCQIESLLLKGKVLPYSLPSVGPGADPGVQAVSPQVTISHPPDGRLPLLSVRPAFYLRKRSPDGATTECGRGHLISAHYSFIDPKRMKG